MKTAISFGSCMAGSIIQEIRERKISELKLTSRVLHNRSDSFANCFIRSTHRPIEWKDVSVFINKSSTKEQLIDSRLFINNQSREHIGRHAIDTNTSFFQALTVSQRPLIVIDNYMDIASKILINHKLGCCGFLNWNTLNLRTITSTFEASDYISPQEYVDNLELILKFMRSTTEFADIVVVLFPSNVQGHNDRPAVSNSARMNDYILSLSDKIMKEHDILIHKARNAMNADLTDNSDWSHYTKSYYAEIADSISEWAEARQNISLPEIAAETNLVAPLYSVAVVVQFYQDFDHIRDVIEALDWVDEIIINDGPFEFAANILESILSTGAGYPEKARDFFKDLSNETGINITYHFKSHHDEASKRIFGYSLATQDIVLSVDADEILDLSRSFLDSFVTTDAIVGMFECVNLTHYGLSISRPSPISGGKHPGKPFAFKRDQVSAERHLDYLWLVGTKQSITNTSDYTLTPICRGLHLTNIRSAEGAALKFGFYTALAWNSQKGEERTGPFADCLYYFSEHNSFSSQLKSYIMCNALAASVGFPADFSLAPYCETESSFLANRLKDKSRIFAPEVLKDHCIRPLLPGIPCYIPITEYEEITICINDSLPIQVTVHRYYLGIEANQTHCSYSSYSFNSQKNIPHTISQAALESNPLTEQSSSSFDLPSLRLLQVCCWAGDEAKNVIRETGIPVYASFHKN